MGRTLRITLDKISEFSRTGYFVFGVGALALLFHVFAWDLFGILLFATLICLSLVFVEEYRAWLTLFANILFIVSTQKSPGYGDGSNYYTRPDILYPLIAAVCLMAACMVYRTVKDRKNLKDGKLFIPMGVLCLALLLAGVGQKYYLYSLKATFLMSAALIGVYCVFTATIKREEDSWEYFSTLFAEICLLIAIEVAYVYFLNMINDGSFDGSHDGRWKDRIITGWGVSNVSGELMACFLPFAFMRAEKSKNVVFYELVALFSATMIVFTLSRTGIMVGGVIAIVFIVKTFVHRKEDKRALVLTFVCYMGFLLVAFIALIGYTEFNDVFKYFEDLFNGGYSVDSGRWEIWGRRLKYFIESPVFGVGYARDFCSDFANSGLIFSGFAHNMIMDAIGSGGICNILALGAFLYLCVRTFVKKSPTRFFTVAFGVAYFSVCMFDTTYAIPYCLWFFTLILVFTEKAALPTEQNENIKGKV